MKLFVGDRLDQWRLWGIWFGKVFIGLSVSQEPTFPVESPDGKAWTARISSHDVDPDTDV